MTGRDDSDLAALIRTYAGSWVAREALDRLGAADVLALIDGLLEDAGGGADHPAKLTALCALLWIEPTIRSSRH